MKKLLIIVGVIFLFAACGGKEERTAKISGMEFDSVVVDTVKPLTSEAGSPKCELHLSIQFAKGKKAQTINDTLLRSGILAPDYLSLSGEHLEVAQAVDSFVNCYVRDYVREYGALYQQDREHAGSYDNRLRVNTRTMNGADDVLVYIAQTTLYGGGEHEMKQTLAKNFNVETGHLITLDDIFMHGYEDAIKELIVKKIAKQLDVDDLKALQEKYVFADGDVYIPDNYILEDDKITFIYCEDEIAPHNIGEIRVELKKKDIKEWLK